MIFLSASIPDPKRDPKYFGSADFISIKDAVRALAEVVIPYTHLVWGGHPSISPLIRYVMASKGYSTQQHVLMYQSNFFHRVFPEANKFFERIKITPAVSDRRESLEIMRAAMLTDNRFDAGIFIGGMDGVEEEFEMFKKYQPQAKLLPIASTGAAARILYDKMDAGGIESRLLNDYAYMSLFRHLLKDILPPQV